MVSRPCAISAATVASRGGHVGEGGRRPFSDVWISALTLRHFAAQVCRSARVLSSRLALTKPTPHALFARLSPNQIAARIRVQNTTMHRYRSHTCGALRDERHRQDRAAVRLVPPHPRPRRRAVHRPARPLRPDAGGGRPRQPGVQAGRDAARRMGGAHRRQGAPAPGRHRESRAADRPGRGLHRRDRGAGPGRRTADAGVRRSGISGGDHGSNTASSICAARSCTTTS